MRARAAQILSDTGKFVRDAVPVAKQSPAPTSTRDISTSGLASAIGVLIVWVVHDLLLLDMRPEVAVAIGTIAGFFAARKFQY